MTKKCNLIKTWKEEVDSLLCFEKKSEWKDFKEFWNSDSKDISKNLSIPEENDIENTFINIRTKNANSSWFSISETRFKEPSSFIPEEFEGEKVKTEVKKSRNSKSKETHFKTLKIRIFPETKKFLKKKQEVIFNEKEELDLIFEQFRWYYNVLLKIVYKELFDPEKKKFTQESYSNIDIRNLLKYYSYVEEEQSKEIIIKSLIPNEKRDKVIKPSWWEKVHNKVPRGAAIKLTRNLNSALSNLKNGNIKSFKLEPLKNKRVNSFALFEGADYPVFIRKIKSRYWYRVKEGDKCKKKFISYQEIGSKKGLEVYKEYDTEKYFLLVPIDANWYPENDQRRDKEIKSTNKVVSLDPGIRKFLVGYSPEEVSMIGKDAIKDLERDLKEIDENQSQNKENNILWRKIKNKISELHWKSIDYLIKNYKIILLPDFKVSSMIPKGKTF